MYTPYTSVVPAKNARSEAVAIFYEIVHWLGILWAHMLQPRTDYFLGYVQLMGTKNSFLPWGLGQSRTPEPWARPAPFSDPVSSCPEQKWAWKLIFEKRKHSWWEEEKFERKKKQQSGTCGFGPCTGWWIYIIWQMNCNVILHPPRQDFSLLAFDSVAMSKYFRYLHVFHFAFGSIK